MVEFSPLLSASGRANPYSVGSYFAGSTGIIHPKEVKKDGTETYAIRLFNSNFKTRHSAQTKDRSR